MLQVPRSLPRVITLPRKLAGGALVLGALAARAVPGTRVIMTGGIFTGESRIYLGEQFVVPQQVLARQLDFVVPALEPGNASA